MLKFWDSLSWEKIPKENFNTEGTGSDTEGAVSDTDGAGSDSNNGAVPDTECDGPKPWLVKNLKMSVTIKKYHHNNLGVLKFKYIQKTLIVRNCLTSALWLE